MTPSPSAAPREPARPGVSVVMPCYNEAANIEAIVREVAAVLAGMGTTHEILVVDDASTDASPRILARLAREIPALRVVRHRRNAREAGPMLTGFDRARGGVVVTMDSDGQHDPELIPMLLRHLEGVDAVSPVRRRVEQPLAKRFSSVFANAVRSAIMRDGLRDTGVTFRALRRETLRGLPRFRGLHRFLPCILRMHGWRVAQPEIPHLPRRSGGSVYGMWNRALPGVLDLVGVLWYRRRGVPPRGRRK